MADPDEDLNRPYASSAKQVIDSASEEERNRKYDATIHLEDGGRVDFAAVPYTYLMTMLDTLRVGDNFILNDGEGNITLILASRVLFAEVSPS